MASQPLPLTPSRPQKMLITILVLCLTCWFAGAAPCLRAGGWVAFRLIHHRFESATLLQGLQRGPGIERNQSQGHAAESTVWCSLSSVEWHPTSHRGDTGGRHFRHQLSRRNAIRAAGSAILCPSARGCSCLGMAAFPKASMPRPDPRPRKRPSQGRRDAPPQRPAAFDRRIRRTPSRMQRGALAQASAQVGGQESSMHLSSCLAIRSTLNPNTQTQKSIDPKS